MNAYHHYEDYADLLAFRAKKEAFREEISNLWTQYHVAKRRVPEMASIIEGMINEQVVEWNVQNPKGPTYLDLHGMSVQGAKDYVARMVEGSGKAALEAFCIWKLGILDSTLTLKIVAAEHYFGITSALSSYYQEEKSMEPFAMATRLADITLLIAPIFNVYQDMLKMYHTLQIEDRFKEE
ncbi:unnamed protein product [Caenorhabditis brenneri]